MSEKTDKQRDILLAWKKNPNASVSELADIADASESYVREVLDRFDDYDEFEAMYDGMDREMDRLFGGDGLF
jgi:hypothetical protein